MKKMKEGIRLTLTVNHCPVPTKHISFMYSVVQTKVGFEQYGHNIIRLVLPTSRSNHNS